MTKPILSVSFLCDHGGETHLVKQPFLRFGDGHEPLVRRGGVYFVKAQTVNESETESCGRADGCMKDLCVRAEDSQKSCVRAEDPQKWCVRADGCMKDRYVGAEDSHKSCVRADGCMKERCVQAEDSQKNHAYELKIHQSHSYELMAA